MQLRPRALRIDLRQLLRRLAFLATHSLSTPLYLGLIVGGSLLATFLTSQAVLGRFPFGTAGTLSDVLVAVLHCLLLAYLCAAYLGLIRSAERVVAAVQPHIQQVQAMGDLLRLPPVGRPTLGWFAAAGVGLTFTFFGPYLTEPTLMGPLHFWHPQHLVPESAWHRVLGLSIGLCLGWFAYATFRVSGELSRLAQQVNPVDLFNPEPLHPFTEQGLTNAKLTAGLLAIGSLFALDQGLTLMLLVLSSSTVVLIGVALLLPVVGVHRRMRIEKETELAWCDTEIREARKLLRSTSNSNASPRLSDLVAYRTLVAQLPEWPFDSPTLRQILIYLLIPLGSWIASGLVQSVLERFILAG